MVFFTYLFNPLKDDFQFSAIIVIIRCTLENVRQHLFILWNTSSLRKKKICRISFPRPYFEKLDQSFAFFCVYCTTLVDTLRSHIHSSKIVPFFQDSCCFMLCTPFFLLNPHAACKRYSSTTSSTTFSWDFLHAFFNPFQPSARTWQRTKSGVAPFYNYKAFKCVTLFTFRVA